MLLQRLFGKRIQVSSIKCYITTMNISQLSHQEALDALKRITEKHPELQKDLFQRADEMGTPTPTNKPSKKTPAFPKVPSRAEHSKARVIEYSKSLSMIPSPAERGFDMSKFRQRHVALTIAYLGENYHGFASQEAGGADVDGDVILKRAGRHAAPTSLPPGEHPGDQSDASRETGSESDITSDESGTKRKRRGGSPDQNKALPPRKRAVLEATHYATVESLLFGALNKACFISSRVGSGYNRCGRTDKGVSSSGQVISIRLRSKALRKDAITLPNGRMVKAWDIHTPEGRCSFAGDDIGNIRNFPVPTDASAVDSTNDPSNSPTAAGTPSTSTPGTDPASPTPSYLSRTWCREDGLANSGEPFPAPCDEHDYANVLNAILPPDIRVIGWSDIPDDFSARFSASIRSYRYFFPKRDLDIARMRMAGRMLVGVHDFRNVAKIDLEQTQNFIREVLSIRVVKCTNDFTPASDAFFQSEQPDQSKAPAFLPLPLPCPTSIHTSMQCTSFDPRRLETDPAFQAAGQSVPRMGSATLFQEPLQSKIAELDARGDSNATPESEYSVPPPLELQSLTNGGEMYYLEVVGRAFLWHQVRCIAALLFHVGRGLESPDSIRDLLDIEKCPARPQYLMADEHALLLHHCAFGDEEDITEEEWHERAEAYRKEGGANGEGVTSVLGSKPVRYIRTYPMLYKNMHVSVPALRKLTEELENQWSKYMIQASMVRATLDKVYSLPVDHDNVRSTLKLPPLEDSEANQLIWGEAVSLYGGRRAMHNGHQPLVTLSDADYSIFYNANNKKQGKQDKGKQAIEIKQKGELPEDAQACFASSDSTKCVKLPYKTPGYVPFMDRVQGSRVEDRWNSMCDERRKDIKEKHPTNATKLDKLATLVK